VPIQGEPIRHHAWVIDGPHTDLDRDRRTAWCLIVLVLLGWISVGVAAVTNAQGRVADAIFVFYGVVVLTIMVSSAVLIGRDMRRSGTSSSDARFAAIVSFVIWPWGLILWRRSRQRSDRRLVGWWWTTAGVLLALVREPS
jgi:hypothetical protein